MDRTYSLRCVIKYSDGRIWRSMWDKSGTLPTDKASKQSRECMDRVAIEAKHLETKTIDEIVSCSAVTFDKFQWRAIARAPNMISGSLQVRGAVIGLTIQTKKERITAYIDGTTHIENIEV